MTILTDIGGTFARFGYEEEGVLHKIAKYEAASFPSFEAALQTYTQDHAVSKRSVRIATAAYPDEQGHWRFVNRNKWVIDPQILSKDGWTIECIINDFEAATYMLGYLQEPDCEVLKAGPGASERKCLIGPGTGLGLGYWRDGRVQKTHGGHMPVARLNDEHDTVIKEMAALQNAAVVFETIVSGPGFFKLQELYDEDKALRLFHEFLGLFAATAVVTGHAYGGVYITGGVIEHLRASRKFHIEHVLKTFHFDAVTSVSEALQATPVIYITDPYPALKGLLYA